VRAVGIDPGERRIGVAVSDASGLLASPHSIIERSGDRERDLAQIADVVREVGGEIVVVGVPVSLDGRRSGEGVERAAAEAKRLGERLGLPVEVQDERLTTVLAMRLRRESAGSSGAGSRKARRPKRQAPGRRYDAEAAALILQSWLDARRNIS
jgi:putative Holliday junction resolvase